MFLYLVFPSFLLVFPSYWCHKFLHHEHKGLCNINIYICKKTLTLKAYNKIRRATDIISHSLSERRSTFNASKWSKLSNVTGCFTACIGVLTVDLDNAIWFRLQSGPIHGLSETCDTAPIGPAVSVIVSLKTHQGLEC